MGQECDLTSALSGPRGARPARRRRENGPRACGALAQACHGPLQRIVRRHVKIIRVHPHRRPLLRRFFAPGQQIGQELAPRYL
jgi:hypothetical protein